MLFLGRPGPVPGVGANGVVHSYTPGLSRAHEAWDLGTSQDCCKSSISLSCKVLYSVTAYKPLTACSTKPAYEITLFCKGTLSVQF